MKSGLAIAARLKAHEKVERVHHPAYSNHPGKATLTGYSGLFSFEVTEDVDIPAFVDALKYFRIGVSWGGHESLIVPAKASLEQTPGLNSMARFGVGPRTIRLHIGLESVEDLWADIVQAFAKAAR
jgi:cystathionine beta-lyase/cystathionine gamma-synthase